MKSVRTVAELRAALEPVRRAGQTIGLVPTMGALHEGHRSLISRAVEQCDVAVVTLFVNPAQFDEGADLERYPRSERSDAELAAAAGADVLFAPSVEEVYPAGFATAVQVLGLTDRLEGAARGAAHFRGVCTVVAKLLGMAQPDVLYLGQKDAQQALVLRRMVTDLDLPVTVEVCPTVREPDGLARSSRNTLLAPSARAQARALPAALNAAARLLADGERSPRRLTEAARAELETAAELAGSEPAETAAQLLIDYVELVDPATLAPLTAPLERPALLALAARVGEVRLIDNAIFDPAAPQAAAQALHPSRKALATCSA